MTYACEVEKVAAAELLGDQRCTPQCLLSREPSIDDCRCCCRGEFHGALAAVEVDAVPRRPWYARLCGWTSSWLDVACPVAPAGVAAFNRQYRAAKHTQRPFVLVQRCGKAWEMHFDAQTERSDSLLSDEAAELFEQLIAALIRARRARSGSSGRSVLTAYGVGTRVEAQVLGALAGELLGGNQDGARSCLRALAEDGFVQPCGRVTA